MSLLALLRPIENIFLKNDFFLIWHSKIVCNHVFKTIYFNKHSQIIVHICSPLAV